MANQKTELYFLLALLFGIIVLTFYIFQPFLFAIILAVIFATIFAPVHNRFLKISRQNRGLAALLTTLFVLIVIVVPITFLGIQIFKEATQLYVSLADNGGSSSLLQGIESFVRSLGVPFFPAGPVDFSIYVKQILSWVIQNLGTIFSNVAKIIVDIFMFLIALYYLFKDGDQLKKSVIALSPLQDTYDETIFRKLSRAINSVVRGSFSVALVQGVMTAVGLTIFGVPNSVLWGSVASVSALIPGLGTSLIIIPSVLFLFFSGATSSAFGLLMWGVAAVGLIDNILGPKIVGKGAKLHQFIIMLSMLGGLIYFGPLGIFLGPLVVTLLFVFLEIYASIRVGSSK